MFEESLFLHALGWAILNSFWQMAVLWISYQFITSTLNNLASSTKANICSITMISGFAWFVYTFVSFHAQSDFQQFFSSFNGKVFALDKHFIIESFNQYLPYISFIYLMILLFPLLNLIRSFIFLQKLKTIGLKKINPELRVWVLQISRQLGLFKPIRVYVSTLISSPITIGFLKPIILIPVAAITHLNPSQIEAILLHEITHIRRHDYLLNFVLTLIKTIFYYNPFAYLFIKEIDFEREKTCDDMVLQFNYNRHDYASTLLFFEHRRNETGDFTLAATGSNKLLNRIENIIYKKSSSDSISKKILSGFALFMIFSLIYIFGIIQKIENSPSQNSSTIGLKYPFFLANSIKIQEISSMVYNKPIQTSIQKNVNSSILNTSIIKSAKENAGYYFTSQKSPKPEFAYFITPNEISTLSEDQKQVVQNTVAATKEIVEEREWKKIDASLAEVFTINEKATIKDLYKKQIENLEWAELELKLKQNYFLIDWDQLSGKFNESLVEINKDKLREIYLTDIEKLNEIIVQLTILDLKTIPDTDITSVYLNEQKDRLLKKLNLLKEKKQLKTIKL